MRSAFKAFSLSTSAPQLAMMRSASLAVAAATQGAGSACGWVDGSVPVALAPCGSAAHSRQAAAAVRISAARQNRIDFSQRIAFNRRETLAPQYRRGGGILALAQ